MELQESLYQHFESKYSFREHTVRKQNIDFDQRYEEHELLWQKSL
jgi:hypothetical protein